MLNWAENYRYQAANIHRPGSIEEIQAIVARSHKVKALGTRHSFNHIADTTHDLVSLERLNQVVLLDTKKQSVTVEGGIRYGDLCRYLGFQGWAIHNMASLPHISVAGACATATHGSGNHNRNLAASVSALEIVQADGTLLAIKRGDDDFPGTVVHLGALGIVVRLSLDIVPAYKIRQTVFEGLHLNDLFDQVMSGAYSVSLFTDWKSSTVNQVWVKQKAGEKEIGDTLYGATKATRELHPISHMPPDNCTAQQGVPGPWHERLPHFRFEFTPSSGEELQSEYLLPRQYATEAIRAVAALKQRISPLLQISEIRTIEEDDLWMSPAYRQPCVGIHFTWVKDWEAVRALLPAIDDALAPFQPRPHWGKLFTLSPQRFQPSFPRLLDFCALAERYDPSGKFRNVFLEENVFNSA